MRLTKPRLDCREFAHRGSVLLTMAAQVKNIYASPADLSSGEIITRLWGNSSTRIERIVSHSHQSPPGFWYDQDEDEWVMVLSGSAELEFVGDEVVSLKEGDYLLIPRHVRHRVARTGAETVWLAVHVK